MKFCNTFIRMLQSDAYTDVVELCALLQCLGFSVKSLESGDGNVSQDGGARTVVINCQSSGLHVVLESASLGSCSCPAPRQQQTSGVWQVSGVTGGKQLDKEFGCSLLGSLPKSHRDRLTTDLTNMILCIKQHNETDPDKLRDKEAANKSASMLELKTPEKMDDRHYQIKCETPTRYRSLDTLTGKEAGPSLPAPGILHKPDLTDTSVEKIDNKLVSAHQVMCRRQSTYTLSSTPGSGPARHRNKTSSPIQTTSTSVLDTLISAERAAEDLRNKLANVIKELAEDGKNDSSISSLTLDVSKISVLKGPESSRAQFASSPNLSGLGTVHDDFYKSRLKRYESASTSNLAANKPTSSKDGKTSRLRRLSPNMFKLKKDSPKVDAIKAQDTKSKLSSLLRPRIVTPVRTPRTDTESSPNLSASRKKFNHIKSTIPRLTKKE